MWQINRTVVFLALFNVVGFVFASSQAVPQVKTYQLLNLQEVVSNDDTNCKGLYQSLQELSKKPLSFQFSRSEEGSNNFNLTDQSGQLQNHTYTIVQQKVSGSVVNRVGLGNFTLGNQKINYVIDIAGDTSKSNFKYLYPIIFSGDNAHCYFTALVRPDAVTAQTFKKNIQSGSVSSETDLAK